MRRSFLLAVALFAACGCSEKGAGRTSTATAEPEAEVPAERVRPIAATEAAFPTPTNFHDVTSALRVRASQGDAQAECQLARELDFCSGAEAHAAYLKKIEERVRSSEGSGPISEANRNSVLSTLASLGELRGEYCKGAGTISPSERIKHWRQAALRGHLPSMMQYSSGLAFKQEELLATLDDLKIFKQESARIMGSVAATGNLEANVMLARAYAPQTTGPDRTPLLRQSVQRDAAMSLAYYMVAQEIQQATNSTRHTAVALQTEADTLKINMTPEEVAEADVKFQELKRALQPSVQSHFDPIGQNQRDSDQPTPGSGFCSPGEFVARH